MPDILITYNAGGYSWKEVKISGDAKLTTEEALSRFLAKEPQFKTHPKEKLLFIKNNDSKWLYSWKEPIGEFGTYGMTIHVKDMPDILNEPVREGDVAAITTLMAERGVTVDSMVKLNEEDEDSMINFAAANIRQQLVQLLLDKGANMNFKNPKDGKVALHAILPEISGYRADQAEAVAKALLSHPKTDVNIQDNEGWTALMYVCHLKAPEDVIASLLSRQPDFSLKNSSGQDYRQIGIRAGNDEILDFIKKKIQQ